jgi:glucosylceramidase
MNSFKVTTLLLVILSIFVYSGAVTPVTGQVKDYQEAKIYLTSESPIHQLSYEGRRAFEPLDQPDENYPTIMIDVKKSFQTIEGFGGAFTDATAVTFSKMPADKQEAFLTAYFDPDKGHGYNLCRTTIHSCDFSDEMYTYDDVAGDKELKNFSIAHDQQFRIPLIRRALKLAQGNIKIFASPWSPPAWMKTNNNMLYGGKLLPEYFQTWADYFVKYVKAYEKEGIPMWGLTVQNEPMAVQIWESCVFTAEEERDFVRDYLGPTLEKNGLSKLKLMIWDHNRGIMYQRAQVVYDDPKASKYVWGTAFHWYVGDHYDNVRLVHDAFPDKKLIYTEAGMGHDWRTGVNLAKNLIYDLNNWTNAWTHWNMLLDEKGGPNHVGGGGREMIAYDTRSGELTINPPYYFFGHFCRFIKPGAKRIACTSNNDDLIATAFTNTDGSVAVVILNLADSEKMLQLWIDKKAAKTTCPAHGIMTMIL